MFYPGGLAASADASSSSQVLCADGLAFLQASPCPGRERVSCALPSLLSTRTRRQDRFELTDAQHVALLTTLVILPCAVMLSSYPSTLYDASLYTTTHTTTDAITDQQNGAISGIVRLMRPSQASTGMTPASWPRSPRRTLQTTRGDGEHTTWGHRHL